MIKSISIENVRGIKNQTFSLDIIPNKPSLLVAPKDALIYSPASGIIATSLQEAPPP
jgi:hypothetical protein